MSWWSIQVIALGSRRPIESRTSQCLPAHSASIFALGIRIGEELVEYAREHRIPLGINVESVSVRKTEIDASVALFRALAARVRPSGDG